MQLKLSKTGKWTSVALLIGALVLTMIFAIAQGNVRIPVLQVAVILKSALWGPLPDWIDTTNAFIVTEVRLPRILLAAMVGGTLSVIGTAFQAIFRNPMADPYVMGISSGAAFGATLGIVFGFGSSFLGLSGTSVMAFIGAILTVLIVYQLARTGGKISTMNILLAGIVVNAILSAAISLLMILFQNDLDRIVNWTLGSFNAASWQQIQLLLVPMVFGTVWLMSLSRELNALVMGEEEAINLGVPVERVKKTILILSALLAAFAVSVSGIIGFVGLIVPHLFRMIFGANHKLLIPVSFFGGALFLLICDTIARSIVPNMEAPVGIITAVLGGPFFLFLLYNHKKKMV